MAHGLGGSPRVYIDRYRWQTDYIGESLRTLIEKLSRLAQLTAPMRTPGSAPALCGTLRTGLHIQPYYSSSCCLFATCESRL